MAATALQRPKRASQHVGSKKLAIFGANGPTGRLLTELAPAKGHAVSAFTRHPDGFRIQQGTT